MKKILLAVMLLSGTVSLAQSYKITWGDEVKMKKTTTDMDVVAADETGVYFTEESLKLKMFKSVDNGVKLVKFDNNFNEVFEKDYSKELKGLSYEDMQMVDNDLLFFATDYDKRSRTLKLFGAKINKATGELNGEFSELATYDLESRRDYYNIKLDTIANSKNLLMVTDISNNDRTSIAVTVLDNNLKQKLSTVVNLSYERDTYNLEDVKYTAGDKIVLLGKIMEHMVSNSGRTKKRMVFKEYAMAIYNTKGQKEKDINLSADERYVIGGRLIEQPSGELLLAGFYSNTQKKDDLNGFFINRIDVDKGALLLSSYKDINAAMLGQLADDKDSISEAGDSDDKQSKKERKKKEDDSDEEEFPNSFVIRSVNINPADNSYLLTAEISQYSSYTYTTYVPAGPNGMSRMETRTVYRFTNKDILVIDADQQGIIKWINDVPKYQYEEFSSSGMGFGIHVDYSGYFAQAGGAPYYSSFTSLIKNNQMIIVMNDHTKNTGNKEYGNRVKKIYNYKKSSTTFGVAIDLTSGATSRKPIADNSDDIILMPRHSFVVSNTVFIPSMRQKMIGKSQLKMAKITVI